MAKIMWWRHITSEPVMFLHAFAFFINISTLPQLVIRKMCLLHQHGNITANECKVGNEVTPEVSNSAASWWFIILISSQVPAIFTILVWGPISDAVGRLKSVTIIPVFNILQNIVFTLCAYYINSHPGFLCIGMFLSCFYGEFSGVITLSCSLIADATVGRSSKSRMARMAFIDVAITFAGLPAGVVAGQLLQRFGFTSVFVFTIGINTTLFFYIIFILPKNLTYIISNREPSECVTLNKDLPKKTFFELIKLHKQIRQVYRVVTDKSRRHLIIPILVIFMFCIYGFIGEVTTTAIFLKGKPLSLNPEIIGYYYANQALIRSIGLIVITQIARRIRHASAINIIMFGLSSQTMCFLFIGLSNTTLFVFLSNLAGFGVAIPQSALRSHISTLVPQANVGAVMASIESLDNFSFVANLLSIEVYKRTSDKFSGAVFILFSSCALFAFVLTLLYKFYVNRLPPAKEIDLEFEDLRKTNVIEDGIVLVDSNEDVLANALVQSDELSSLLPDVSSDGNIGDKKQVATTDDDEDGSCIKNISTLTDEIKDRSPESEIHENTNEMQH